MDEEKQQPDQNPIEEPSVLDFVKSLFRGKAERIQLPDFAEAEQPEIGDEQPVDDQPEVVERQPVTTVKPMEKSKSGVPQTPFPWRSLLALILALIGQKLFEPPPTTIPLGIAFYIAAFSALGWSIYRGEWKLAPLTETSKRTDPLTYHALPLIFGVAFGISSFVLFRYIDDNMFTRLNFSVWIISVVLLVSAFWIRNENKPSLASRLRTFFRNGSNLKITSWTLLLIAATAVVFFFRFYRTTSVPPQPFSDHAEKLLDVYDVSQGLTHVFFPRNTGREAIQMYWTLLISDVFNTGLSFISLKLGTAILGFLTLPYMYLLGKEVGNKRVGFFAFVLTGIGYWPNVISRVGLRFPLYPLFAAPVLYYLIRGLRTRNRNDFILSGLFLGAGLHGYSPMRIVPIVVVAAFIVYWLHSQSKNVRRDVPIWLAILALVSLFVFMPLMGYWLGHPAEFDFRAMSRMTGMEQALPGPPLQIFASNVWKALKMYNFDDGEIWVNSVTHRPALDIISGALFAIGVLLVLIRYIRKRHWLDMYLLVSMPLLQLPSTLSLAFPGENPALNRAGGAYIPAFIIAALALDGLLTSFGRGKMRTTLIWTLSCLLLFSSASQNFDLVFNQYYTAFSQGSWNTSDMGQVIKGFASTYGSMDNTWVVPFPYWVDTRLPAVWAGVPNRDMAMQRDNLGSTVELKGPKLFIVKADPQNPDGNDGETIAVLKLLYPDGQLRLFTSNIPGHDFWIFIVPK